MSDRIGPSRLLDDLRAAGVADGDSLVVHASLKSIGQVDGGPEAVVACLVEAVGPGGVALFPSLTFDGSMTQFLRRLDGPVDLRRIESRNGAIPRAAGRHPAARRSVHPTHPVIAIGQAETVDHLFGGDQDGQGPLGRDCPFYRAAAGGGTIALIGVTNRVNTTLHCLEEAAAPYIFNCGETFTVPVIGDDGAERTIRVRGYTTDTPRDFDAIEPVLLAEGIMTLARLGRAELRIIDGRRLLTRGLELLGENPRLLARGH
jgi:aminoglycoside 3-N-acetyltransferase